MTRRTCFIVFAIVSVAAKATQTDIVSSGGSGYIHTVWTQSDGVPPVILHIAQTPDGWIWVAGLSDLYRFDGLTFERRDMLPAGNPSSRSASTLFVSTSGDLWVGYQSGLTAVRPANDPEHPHLVAGTPAGPAIDSFAEDGDGRMWVTTAHGLYRLDQHGWREVEASWGLHGALIYHAVTDRDGTLWATTGLGIFRLKRGQSHFDLVDATTRGNGKLGLTADGRIWLDNMQDTVVLDLPGTPRPGQIQTPMQHNSHSNVFDENGGIWTTRCPDVGVCRTAHSDAAALHAVSKGAGPVRPGLDRMSSARAVTILEDRQGAVWVGTATGLERFRRSPFSKVGLPPGYFNFAMAAGDAGELWLGSAAGTHADYLWGHTGRQGNSIEYEPHATTALYRDTDGSFLLGGAAGTVRRYAQGQFAALSKPAAWSQDNDTQAIVRDGTGHLWVAVRGWPIYRLDNDQWVAKGGIDALPNGGLVRAVADGRKRLWLGYINALYIVDGNHARAFSRADGLNLVMIDAIIPDGVPLVAGENGLAAFDGNRFHAIMAEDPDALTAISGMVRLRDGSLWLNGAKGAARIAAADLEHAIADPAYEVPVRLYGTAEGYPGSAQQYRPLPTLVEGTDGRLWFAGTGGLSWLDPKTIRSNTTEPNVVVRAIVVSGHEYDPAAMKPLAAGTRNLRIDYTALLLGDAERANFRYRLDGVDPGWQEAGNRREAFYTNLGPGTYHFHVMASNEDGLWSREGAGITFSIRPTFFQTGWFLALCIFATLLLLWIAYSLHIRQVTSRLHQRLEERHRERTRIARELHDTFLQAVQGLVLKVHAASRGLPQGQARESLAKALDVADKVIIEGRERVHQLREIAQDRSNLQSVFTDITHELQDGESPVLDVSAVGTARPINPLVIDELYSAGREALLNAVTHSHAQKVSLVVSYERAELSIRIYDDGQGIDQAVLETGGRSHHWGLQGMHERMERIGGSLEVISNHGQAGTRVILRVPSSRAYVHRSSFPWFRSAFDTR